MHTQFCETHEFSSNNKWCVEKSVLEIVLLASLYIINLLNVHLYGLECLLFFYDAHINPSLFDFPK